MFVISNACSSDSLLVRASSSQNPLTALTSFISNLLWPTERKEPYHTTLAALSSSSSPSDVVSSLVHLAISVAMPFAKVVAQVVDFYLNDARAAERADIVQLAARPAGDAQAEELLLGYIREASRTSPARSSQRRASPPQKASPTSV